MATYRVPFTIVGHVLVEAHTAEEAKAIVDYEYGERELAELGCLEVHEAERDRDERLFLRTDITDEALKESRHG